MLVFNTIKALKETLAPLQQEKKTIGFVPTMGALHAGHISLIQRAVQDNNVTVCSIFVNPIQFNNKKDLEKYPRDVKKDIKMLENSGCEVVFNPSVKEMYPKPIETKYNFGSLENVMEGEFRTGHFNGVAVVVKRLFDIVEPNNAYFGEKDFQQIAIIRKLTEIENLDVRIIGCPIIREFDGLAMSSRNTRLNTEERKQAPFIYRILKEAKNQLLHNNIPVIDVKKYVENQFDRNEWFQLQYFEVAEPKGLEPVLHIKQQDKARLFIAAYLGDIRLIDNLEIYS